MAISPLIGAWLAGMLGGAHCLAMCGGFVAALSGAATPPPRRAAASGARAACDSSRTTSGESRPTRCSARLGAAGAALSAAEWLPLQRTLYVVANLFLLVLAVAIVEPRFARRLAQRAGLAMFGR